MQAPTDIEGTRILTTRIREEGYRVVLFLPREDLRIA